MLEEGQTMLQLGSQHSLAGPLRVPRWGVPLFCAPPPSFRKGPGFWVLSLWLCEGAHREVGVGVITPSSLHPPSPFGETS